MGLAGCDSSSPRAGHSRAGGAAACLQLPPPLHDLSQDCTDHIHLLCFLGGLRGSWSKAGGKGQGWHKGHEKRADAALHLPVPLFILRITEELTEIHLQVNACKS